MWIVVRFGARRNEGIKLERSGKAITICQTGRIYGLKDARLLRNAEAECEKIIRGTVQVVPSGMEAHVPEGGQGIPSVANAARQQQGTGSYEHPYLNSMQYRKGGYALLCAFRFHRKHRGFHYKDELIRDSQVYCDEAMNPNFFAGRTHTAGWKSIESLVRHRLVNKRDMRGARVANGRAGNGFGGGGRDEYELSTEGEKFVDAMLNKWPIEEQNNNNDESIRGSVHRNVGRGLVPQDLQPFAMMPETQHQRQDEGPPVQPNKKCTEDIETLHRWLETASEDNVMSLNVSKVRRQYMHNYCDYLERQNGYSFQHASMGDGRQRTLIVRLISKGELSKIASIPSPSNIGIVGTSVKSSEGKRLGGKRNYASMNPREAALVAANARINNNQDSIMPGEMKEDNELKTAIESSLIEHYCSTPVSKKVKKRSTPDDAYESDLQSAIKASLIETTTRSLVEDKENSGGCIYIDNRERVSNNNRRQMVVGLRNLFVRQTSSVLESCSVDRLQLSAGDFAWKLSSGYMARCLVERKQIR